MRVFLIAHNILNTTMVRGCEGNRHNNDNNEGISMKTKLLMGGVLAALISTSALAETITFNGSVGSITGCTIDSITDGTLAVSPSQPHRIGTGYAVAGGVDAEVTVTTTDSSFKLVAVSDFNNMTFTAANGGVWPTITSGSPNFGSRTGTYNTSDTAMINGVLQPAISETLTTGTATRTVTLNLTGPSGWIYPVGDYTATVGVACVPQ